MLHRGACHDELFSVDDSSFFGSMSQLPNNFMGILPHPLNMEA